MKLLRSMRRALCYCMYYGFARHLPRSYELYVIGRASSWLRKVICRPLFKQSARDVFIERKADFGSGRCMILEENACLGENLRIMGMGLVTVKKNAMIGPDVFIISENHKFNSESFDGYDVGQVVIGEQAWIGARSVILKDVTLGKSVIVGAGTVVTKSVPDYGVVVGNPGKIIKYSNQKN
jgi:maltose O-acetyltransferase